MSEDEEEYPAVVIDNGSAMVKAGLAGEDAPRIVFTSLIGRPKRSIMFEKFHVPAFYVSIQAVLSMYAGGRVSAIMLDSGDGLSHVLPIYEGRALMNTIRRVNFAGSEMTSYLTQLLNERGNCFTTSAEREIVRDIKEKHCYVAEDFEAEMSSSKTRPGNVEREYELPDGRKITIGDERFRVPECLFRPDLLSMDCEGLHESVVRCLQECDIDTRADLFCNIVLSGGNTMYPGLPQRLISEIRNLAPQKLVKINVLDYPDRKYNVWIGGSILASLSTFRNMYIKKEVYEEEGPRIVHRRCF